MNLVILQDMKTTQKSVVLLHVNNKLHEENLIYNITKNKIFRNKFYQGGARLYTGN